MAAQTEDKKLDGAGLSVLWGLIKNIIPTVPTNVSSFTNDAAYVSQLETHNQNLVLASPNGASGLSSFRALVAADIPDLSGTYLTSASLNGYATQSWVTSQGFGTVSSIKVGTTSYSPSSGVVSLPAYPTTLPASDVYSWAKASSKPSYTYTEVGAASSGHTHSTSIGTSTGTNQITLAFGTKYAITAGGTSYVFTMPSNPDTWRPLGTGASDACAGNDSRLSNSRPASDVYSWAKQSTKPSYSWSEIGSRPTKLSEFTNDSGFITGITSSMVTTALGFTPANSTSLSSYLPLSGGTMTGNIAMGEHNISGVYILSFDKNNTSEVFHIYRTGVTNVNLGWNYDNKNGSVIGFRSASYTNNPGAFCIFARTATLTAELQGKPNGTLTWGGSMYATAFNNTSDIRNKDFVSDLTMDIEQIANAPTFKFRWKTGADKDVKAGSSAQYWNMVLPETVSAAQDEQRTLSMQYDVIALLSAITIAKEVVNDKERIRQLEQRVSQLEAQLAN